MGFIVPPECKRKHCISTATGTGKHPDLCVLHLSLFTWRPIRWPKSMQGIDRCPIGKCTNIPLEIVRGYGKRLVCVHHAMEIFLKALEH